MKNPLSSPFSQVLWAVFLLFPSCLPVMASNISGDNAVDAGHGNQERTITYKTGPFSKAVEWMSGGKMVYREKYRRDGAKNITTFGPSGKPLQVMAFDNDGTISGYRVTDDGNHILSNGAEVTDFLNNHAGCLYIVQDHSSVTDVESRRGFGKKRIHKTTHKVSIRKLPRNAKGWGWCCSCEGEASSLIGGGRFGLSPGFGATPNEAVKDALARAARGIESHIKSHISLRTTSVHSANKESNRHHFHHDLSEKSRIVICTYEIVGNIRKGPLEMPVGRVYKNEYYAEVKIWMGRINPCNPEGWIQWPDTGGTDTDTDSPAPLRKIQNPITTEIWDVIERTSGTKFQVRIKHEGKTVLAQFDNGLLFTGRKTREKMVLEKVFTKPEDLETFMPGFYTPGGGAGQQRQIQEIISQRPMVRYRLKILKQGVMSGQVELFQLQWDSQMRHPEVKNTATPLGDYLWTKRK